MQTMVNEQLSKSLPDPLLVDSKVRRGEFPTLTMSEPDQGGDTGQEEGLLVAKGARFPVLG